MNRRSTVPSSKTQALQSSRFKESFFSSSFFRKLTSWPSSERLPLTKGEIPVTQTSSRRLQDVFERSRRHATKPDVVTTSGKNVGFSTFRLLEGVRLTSSWRRPIYDVSKTSDLRRLEDVWFMTSWWRPIYVFLETSSRRLIYNLLRTSDLRRLKDVQFTTSKEMIFSYFILSAIFRKFNCSCWG